MPHFQRFPLGLSSSQPRTATGSATAWKPHQPMRQGKPGSRGREPTGESSDEDTRAPARGALAARHPPLPSCLPRALLVRLGSAQPGAAARAGGNGAEAAGCRLGQWAFSTHSRRAADPSDDAIFTQRCVKPSRPGRPPRLPRGASLRHQPPR